MTGRQVAEETLEKLRDILGGIPNCPICNNNNWDVSDKVSLTGTIDPNSNNVNPASGIPSVKLNCKNCGFIASFNPKSLGTM